MDERSIARDREEGGSGAPQGHKPWSSPQEARASLLSVEVGIWFFLGQSQRAGVNEMASITFVVPDLHLLRPSGDLPA